MTDHPATPSGGNVLRRLRIGVALAVWGAALFAAFANLIETCSEATAVVGSTLQVVVLCEPASLVDPRYVLVLAAGLMLLWPDLSEFSIGSLALKRRVERSEEKHRSLEAEVFSLRQTVTVEQSVKMPVYLYVNLDDPAVTAPLREPSFEDTRDREHVGLEPAQMAAEILASYERLRVFHLRGGHIPDSLNVIEGRRDHVTGRWEADLERLWPEASGLPLPMLAEQAYVFSKNFPESLGAVQAVRNAIAHAHPVQDDDLKKAHDLSQALTAFLLDRFTVFRDLQSGAASTPEARADEGREGG